MSPMMSIRESKSAGTVRCMPHLILVYFEGICNKIFVRRTIRCGLVPARVVSVFLVTLHLILYGDCPDRPSVKMQTSDFIFQNMLMSYRS